MDQRKQYVLPLTEIKIYVFHSLVVNSLPRLAQTKNLAYF